MATEVTLTEQDEGKVVVTRSDEEIGRITSVKNNAAAVQADTGLTGRIRSTLGWESAESGTDSYRLQAADVESKTSNRVIVRDDFRE